MIVRLVLYLLTIALLVWAASAALAVVITPWKHRRSQEMNLPSPVGTGLG
ncbi:hypothetical protein ACFWYW_39420 [Nonomuraea sp. NPDC059023]